MRMSPTTPTPTCRMARRRTSCSPERPTRASTPTGTSTWTVKPAMTPVGFRHVDAVSDTQVRRDERSGAGQSRYGHAKLERQSPGRGRDRRRALGGPAIRAPRDGDPTRKSSWRQRSTDGKTRSDITEDGGATVYYTPVAGDVGYCLRSCVFLNDTAPEGATEACVRMFARR